MNLAFDVDANNNPELKKEGWEINKEENQRKISHQFKQEEITPHRDGHGVAPELSLSEILSNKLRLKPTSPPTRAQDGKTSVYKGMCLEADTPAHLALQTLFNRHKGNLTTLAGAVKVQYPQYYLDESKLLNRMPTTAKTFAWQCVEGYYCSDETVETATGIDDDDDDGIDPTHRALVLENLKIQQLDPLRAESIVRKITEPFGTVASLKLPKEAGQSTVVIFSTAKEAKTAELNLNGLDVDGVVLVARVLMVSISDTCQTKKKKGLLITAEGTSTRAYKTKKPARG
jgi:hypothetical protein